MSLPLLKARYSFTFAPSAHAFWARQTRHFLLLVGLVVAGIGCSDTRAIQLDECGNHVLEAGEDCDGSKGCGSTCHFSCSAGQACPSGYGCDRQAGVCRTSSGGFHDIDLPVDDSGTLSSADFDGDGRDELVFVGAYGPVAASISFFSSSGELERSVGLPAASSAAALDVTDDGLPDIIVGGSSVSAFQSSKSRRFSPLISALVQVAKSALLFSADVDCDGQRDFILLDGNRLSRVSPSGALTTLTDVAVSAQQVRDLERAATFGTVPSYRAVGRFDTASLERCEMLALPGARAGQVDIYGPNSARAVTLGRLATVAYPVDTQLPPNRWLFVDINADGYDDLLITGPAVNYVSYGVGDGTFHSDRLNLPVPFSSGADGKVVELEQDNEILAAGGPLGEEPVQLFSALESVDGTPYGNARVVDLTGDGKLDVAAVGGGRRVDVLRGLSSGHLSGLSLPTTGIPSIQDVADFDGDGYTDVLLSEAASLDEDPKTASVLFSQVTNDSSGPIDLAEFAGISQMVAGYLNDGTEPADSNADIGVLYGGQGSKKNLGFLAGGSDRLLRSQLPTAPAGKSYVAERVPVLGHFRNKDKRDLIVAEDLQSFEDSSFTGATRIALFSIDANGTSQLASVPLALRLNLDYGVGAIDADGDGFDELYVTGDDALFALRGDNDTFQVKTALAESSLEDLQVQDADANGKLDVAVTRGDELWLLTAASGSTPSKWHHFSTADVGCANAYINYAFIQADQDPELELAIGCPYSGVVADDPGQGGASPGEPGPTDSSLRICNLDLTRDKLSVAHITSFENTDRFVVGDFNGDGVQDIAGSFVTQKLLLGVPR